LLTIFTEDFGKIEVLAKAVRKTASKLRPAVEPGYCSEIEFIEGKTHKTLTDAVLLQKYAGILSSLAKRKIMFLLLDLVADLTGSQAKDEAGFRNLKKTLEELDRFTAKNASALAMLYLYFAWNFLKHEGYAPELYRCAQCAGKPKKEELFFSADQGGMVCRVCCSKMKQSSKIPIGADELKALRFFLQNGWDVAKKLKMGAASLRSLSIISIYYLRFIRSNQKY